VRDRRERGQSTVEFALLIPLVLVAILAVIQVALIAYAQLAVTHAARETARTLVVDPTVGVDQTAQNSVFLGAQYLVTSVSFQEAPTGVGQTVLVSVTYDVPPISGIFATFLADFEVRGEVEMLVEN